MTRRTRPKKASPVEYSHTTVGQAKACAKKKRYLTKGAAKAACTRQARDFSMALWFYRCKCCRTWHLTKSPPLRNDT